MDNSNVKSTPTRHLIKDILGSNDDSSECLYDFPEQPLNLCISKEKSGRGKSTSS